ncbi:VWA domain-containing protein [Parafrankia elaeagni]|uniref:VWA domain-containing protein n=1 Tax=Parafrankia elaeagni TaxID=222534 RepID=UPI0003A55409|nr:VWA domain-containing protein [Parafrankia elaeagni]
MTLQSSENPKREGLPGLLSWRVVAVALAFLCAAAVGVPATAAPRAATPATGAGVSATDTAATAATATPAAGAAPATAGSAEDIEPRAVRAVIIADESGSLDAEAVRQEKEAVELLAFSALTPDSEIAVVGFGSSNGEPGQQAVQTYCPLTKADPEKQQSLVTCIDGLHRREPSEGNDTDHAAAIGQALSILGPARDDSSSLIFLLTDGRLDVPNSPQYGAPAARNTEAGRQLSAAVARARENGVQIWPLGFGSADKSALDVFAAGGAQQTCSDLEEYQPKARLATSLSEVTRSLFEAIGNANCARTTGFETDELQPGSSAEVEVEIPEISTDGVIVAVKGDPRVRVAYIDPENNDVSDREEFDRSVFTRSTPNGTVESLRVQNPRPGTWKVRFTAPDGLSSQQTVGAAAMWQGVLRAVVLLDPPVPGPGQEAVITVRLQTRDGEIKDPRTLDGIRFGAQVSGAGFDEEQVSLVDDGTGGDAQGGDAVFSGRIAIPPDATGNLTIRGTVVGPGVVGASVDAQTVIQNGPAPLTASMKFDSDGTVAPGESLSGTVVLDNIDGRAHTLSLQLQYLVNGVNAVIDPPTITSTRRGRSEHRFTVTFAEDSAQGPTGGTAVLVDAGDSARTIAWAVLRAEVREPPSWLDRFWWLLVLLGALVLALVLFAAWRLRAAREAGDVSNVTVRIFRDGGQVGELRARRDTGGRFAFVVHDATGTTPRLDYAHGGTGYVVTRDRHRVLLLRTPSHQVQELRNQLPVPIEGGLTLVVAEATTSPGAFPPGPGADDPYERAGDYRSSGEDHGDSYLGGGTPSGATPGGGSADSPGRGAPGGSGRTGAAAGGVALESDQFDQTTIIRSPDAGTASPGPFPAKPPRRSWRPGRRSRPQDPLPGYSSYSPPTFDDLSD